MKKLAQILCFGLMAGSLFGLASPQVAQAASCDNATFLGMPAWYRGLTDSECNIKSIGEDGRGEVTVAQFVWTIVLNLIDGLFRLIGLASVGFIVYAGFQYMLSQGDSGKVAGAKTTLTNAIIGLVISLLSITLTNFIIGVLR